MTRTLIAYSTVDGHTLKIAVRLQQSLERWGHEVALKDIGKCADLDLTAFDQVVIGASIRYGKHRPEVYDFIESHRAVLDHVPSAFFSVNLVARKPGKDTADANPYVKIFRRTTTWLPGEVAVFAGMLDYPRYRLLDRQLIRLIMWMTHGPTDPKTRVEFTDWQAVDKFAGLVAELRPTVRG
jgi:menaquinone-dependent protoporphyrinogen oxidase